MSLNTRANVGFADAVGSHIMEQKCILHLHHLLLMFLMTVLLFGLYFMGRDKGKTYNVYTNTRQVAWLS